VCAAKKTPPLSKPNLKPLNHGQVRITDRECVCQTQMTVRRKQHDTPGHSSDQSLTLKTQADGKYTNNLDKEVHKDVQSLGGTVNM